MDQLRKDMEVRLDREKKLLADQLRQEIEDVERDEESKYERKVE